MGAGGSRVESAELDEWLAPYLDTWLVKVRGGRDRAIISKDKIVFWKDGDTSVTTAYTTNSGGTNNQGRQVGGGHMGSAAQKSLSFGKSPTGEIYWDGFGSFCSVPIENGNPNSFTMRLQYGFGEPKYTIKFEREIPAAYTLGASEYSGRHIVGISGRAGDMVDQLTLHYSDGTTKIKGGPGGGPVPAQMFDPAVDGHIIQVEWDEMPDYLGGGFRFHLSGGKVITVDGNACRWRQGDLKMTRSWKGPPPPEDGPTVAYALLGLTWGLVKGTTHFPKGAAWQELPPAVGA